MIRGERRPLPDALGLSRVFVIVRAPDARTAVTYGLRLFALGAGALEVSCTTPDAAEAIAELRAALGPDAALGAGTVLTPAQLDETVDAGASFVVAPNIDLAVAAHANERQVAYLPGAMTATEAVQAWDAGASAVKLFPAGTLGVDYLRQLQAPLPHIPFVVVGGVELASARGFLDAGAVAVGIGSSLAAVSEDTIRDAFIAARMPQLSGARP